MAVGSGLASSVGLAAETTYGTPVTVSRFLEINKPSLQKVKNTTQGGGLAAGRLVAPASRRVVTSRAAKGSLDLDVVNKGMGLLLAQIFGGAPTPVQQGATTAYLQTHPLTDNIGRSLTVQAGVPDLGGTVRPYTYQGAKVTDAEFDCGVDDLLGLKVNLDIQDVTEATALVAPSYAATQVPFHWGQGTVKLGTSVGSEVAVDGVRKVNIKIARGQKTDRFYYGGGGVKKEPVTNAMTKITGTFETDFLTKADFADRYRDDTQLSLVWEFIGPQISGVYYQTFRLRVPALFLDEGTPQVDGPDVVKPKFTWTALHDGVNAPITCELITTDTTL